MVVARDVVAGLDLADETLGRSGPTIDSYFRAFSPAPPIEDLCRWPPDVFALASLVLDHTEAYRFAVAPIPGKRWPPSPNWNERVLAAAAEWRATAADTTGDPPDSVCRDWGVVTSNLDIPLLDLRRGECYQVLEALITLHAMADEACSHLSRIGSAEVEGSFEQAAWNLMESQGSLARIDPSRVRVTPKTHFAARGITIRSLSRYLALNYESIDVQWRRIAPARWSAEDRQEYNLVLLPWPLVVRAEDFRPVEGPLENMDPTAFGFFEFDPKVDLDIDLVAGVIRQARRKVRRVHALVMPEGAVKVEEIPAVERILARHGVAFLITGVREATTEQRLGSNYLHLGVFTKDGWQHYRQAKHHRWCLDGSQIRQYHLSRALDPSRLWWEAIDLPIRTAQIIDIGNGATIAPLVCEDLARLDEVADLLRRVGPSLVVTLLLDGPQLPQRWPCRYATVLADEPGSAVLTLTSSGMASRSTPANKSRSRATAMWSDPQTGLRQIELGRGAKALLLTAAVEPKTVWTADGRRHHDNTPSVTLTAVQQLRVSERD